MNIFKTGVPHLQLYKHRAAEEIEEMIEKMSLLGHRRTKGTQEGEKIEAEKAESEVSFYYEEEKDGEMQVRRIMVPKK